MFNALQHINTKSTMLLKTLFDFSGTAQKDTLVNLAPCTIKMCKLMTNHACLNGATNMFKAEEFPQFQGKELCPREYYL